MRTHAPGRVADARRPAHRHRAPTASMAPGRALSERDSLLEHLDVVPLARDWHAATADAPAALPHRDELQARFGRRLDHLEVHAGPRARTLLDALGAVGAARGEQILLRAPDAPLEVVAHEVAHALQAGAVVAAGWPGVLAEGDVAETGAAAAAGQALAGDRVSPGLLSAAAGRPGWIALFRRGSAVREEDVAEGPAEAPEELEVDDAPAAADVAARPRAPRAPAAPVEPTTAEAPTRTPSPAPPVGEEEIEAAPVEARETEPPAGERPERAPGRAGARPAPGPDRQQEIRDGLGQGQATWDEASTQAADHEVSVCPRSAVQPGEHPFVRGPPLDVPPVTPDSVEPAPEPEPVDEDANVRAADAAATAQLARGPPATDSSLVPAPEQRAAIRELETEIEGEGTPPAPETPLVSLTGEADPALVDERSRLLDTRARADERAALDRAHEDFGEHGLAPATDPTLGHDSGLDALQVPDVQLEDVLPAERLDRVATDGNAGQQPLDAVLVARDEDVAHFHETVAQQDATRAEVDQRLGESDAALERMCDDAGAAREHDLADAREGVAGRRARWRSETEGHVRRRRREGTDLARSRREHVARLRRDADDRSGRRMRGARGDADRRWREARGRAVARSREGHDPSWWERGLDWFRRQLDRLREWIQDFLDACRRAIHALLEAARAAAHAIVDAAQRAISATIQATRRALDVIVDNLPGELGEIARTWRDDAHRFLDGVQRRLDRAAGNLHRAIDTHIDDLGQRLDLALGALEAGLLGAVDLLDQALQANPLMALLREHFPGLAALVDLGLDGLAQQAADRVNAWVESAVESTGLDRLTQWLQDMHRQDICSEESVAGAGEAGCAAFEGSLQQALEWVDGLLASPAAQSVQAELQASRDAQVEQQVDALSSFLGFVQFFAAPLYRAWQAVERGAGLVLDALGKVGRVIWRHVAAVLGIDPDIDPLTALRNGIQALWDAVVDATRPLVDGIREAWRWLREQSPLAPFIDFVASLPELWQSLKDLAGRIADGLGEALAAAADAFRAIVPAIEAALRASSRVLHRLIDVAAAFVDGLLSTLEGLLSWESGIALLDALVGAVQAVLAPIVAAQRLLADCALLFWRTVADGIRSMLRWIRTINDIAVGVLMSLSLPPISIVAFLAGSVWLYLVPDCCQAPLLNFFLEVCIRLLRFLPEPADFMLGALYNGALAFLEELLRADDDTKVKAMNLFASIFAGNIEVAAGIAVGLLAGVWESTGGTIIFLLQAVAWLIALPFKLTRWAVGVATGTVEEEGVGAPATAPAAAETAPAAADDETLDEGGADLRSSRDPPGHRAPAERPSGEPVRAEDTLPAEGTTPEGARAGLAPDGEREAPTIVQPLEISAASEDAARARPEPETPAERFEEEQGALAPTTEEEEAAEQEATPEEVEDIDEAEPGVEEGGELGGEEEEESAVPAEPPVAIREAPSPRVRPGPEATAATARLSTTAPRAPPTRLTPPASVQAALPAAIAAPAVAPTVSPVTAEEAGSVPGEDEVAIGPEETGGGAAAGPEEAAPEAPDLPSIGELLCQLATEGFSREDVASLIEGVRGATRDLARSLAETAAQGLLEALSAEGVAFTIGVTIGTIAGMVLVELLLAYFTAGASTAVTTAKAILQGSRGVAKLASVVAKLRRAIEPLFTMIQRIRKTSQGLLGRVMGWLDNVVQWMQRTLRRLLGRGRAPAPARPPAVRPAPRPARPPRAPARPVPTRPAAPRRATRPVRPGGGRRPPGARRPAGARRPSGARRPAGTRRPGGPRRSGRRPGAGRGRPGRGGRRRGRGGRRGRPGGVAARVRLAATAAWRAVTALARQRVVRRNQALHTARSAARSAAPGLSMRVATRHLGPRMWTLRVTGRRGRRRATVSRGRAWFGRDERRTAWYSAAPDQTRRHRQAVENLDRNLQRRVDEIVRREPVPRELHRKLQPDIRSRERQPQPRLLSGVTLDVDESRYHWDRQRQQIEYHYRIGPNANGGLIVQDGVPTYLGGPTWDPAHWLLANADPPITSTGPYCIVATPLPKMSSDQIKYNPCQNAALPGGDDWSRPALHNSRWSACLPNTRYDPEFYVWVATNRRFERQPRREMTRVDKRVEGMQNQVVNLSANQTDPDTVKAIIGYRNGQTSRPAGSIDVEDGFGGHIASHHVLSRRGGVDSLRALAVRAAFELVPAVGGILVPAPLDPDVPVASAFLNLDDANRALRRGSEVLGQTWRRGPHYRRDAVARGNRFDFVFAIPPTEYRVASRRGLGGHAPPVPPYAHPGDRPAYLQGGGGGDRPLSNADDEVRQWRKWWRKIRLGAPPPPDPLSLVTRGTTDKARIVIQPHTGKGSGGFYVRTLYPEL